MRPGDQKLSIGPPVIVLCPVWPELAEADRHLAAAIRELSSIRHWKDVSPARR